MPATITIRSATAADDTLIAIHFYQMWRDNDVPAEAIASNWQAEVQQYLDEARRSLSYQAFVAEVNDRVVGSVGCQRFAGLYPNILEASYRQDSYIWGVYVEPDFRRQGIATQLTDRSPICDRSAAPMPSSMLLLRADPFTAAWDLPIAM